MNTIIVVVIDTLRRDHLGCYGAERVKVRPNFDAFAEHSVNVRQTPIWLHRPACRRVARILTGRYEFPFRGWGPWSQATSTCPRHWGRPAALRCSYTDQLSTSLNMVRATTTSISAAGNFCAGRRTITGISIHRIASSIPAPERTKCHFAWAQYMRNTAQWRDADGTLER